MSTPPNKRRTFLRHMGLGAAALSVMPRWAPSRP
jgi:hypothetical protein